MSPEEALNKFNQYKAEAEATLELYAKEDPIKRNQAITAHYHAIAEADPLFVWFNAATLGSHQVGRALNNTQGLLTSKWHVSMGSRQER